MPAADSNLPGEASPGPVFVTTHWSVVLAASGNDSACAHAALEHLCRLYWYPIYYFVRRQGYATHDAQDFTQEFFARLLEKHWIAGADQSCGRFRSFLLLMVKRFLISEWRRASAQKRAGNLHCLPLPLNTAEMRYAHEPADTHTPDQAFEKQWALTLLETVVHQVAADYEQEGRGDCLRCSNRPWPGAAKPSPTRSWLRRCRCPKGRCAWRSIACANATASASRPRWPIPSLRRPMWRASCATSSAC